MPGEKRWAWASNAPRYDLARRVLSLGGEEAEEHERGAR